jgi:hypothetical protein
MTGIAVGDSEVAAVRPADVTNSDSGRAGMIGRIGTDHV